MVFSIPRRQPYNLAFSAKPIASVFQKWTWYSKRCRMRRFSNSLDWKFIPAIFKFSWQLQRHELKRRWPLLRHFMDLKLDGIYDLAKWKVDHISDSSVPVIRADVPTKSYRWCSSIPWSTNFISLLGAGKRSYLEHRGLEDCSEHQPVPYEVANLRICYFTGTTWADHFTQGSIDHVTHVCSKFFLFHW